MEIKIVLDNLRKRHIKAEYFADRSELIECILKETIEDKTVGFGGSITLEELGLYEILKASGKEVYWHWKVNPEQRLEILHKAKSTDAYFSSSNAITLDGRLVNIDGNANRVSSMIFGPKKVFIIIGRNKIANDLDDAINRIKTVACPNNARRLGRKVPCALTNQCADCISLDRMCSVTTIIEGNIPTIDMRVYLLDEVIGY